MSTSASQTKAQASYHPSGYVCSSFSFRRAFSPLLISTYMQGMSDSLKRARKPFLTRNLLTGGVIVAFATATFWYSIAAVQQDDFVRPKATPYQRFTVLIYLCAYRLMFKIFCRLRRNVGRCRRSRKSLKRSDGTIHLLNTSATMIYPYPQPSRTTHRECLQVRRQLDPP